MTSVPVRGVGDLDRRKVRQVGHERVQLAETARMQCPVEPLGEFLVTQATVRKVTLQHGAEPLTLGIRGPGAGIAPAEVRPAPRPPSASSTVPVSPIAVAPGPLRLGPDEPEGTVVHYEDGLVEVHRVVVGPLDNNVHVIRCKQTGDSVLVDAANEHERLLEMCRRLGVRQVLETHGHWDHIQAVPAVREAGFEVLGD